MRFSKYPSFLFESSIFYLLFYFKDVSVASLALHPSLWPVGGDERAATSVPCLSACLCLRVYLSAPEAKQKNDWLAIFSIQTPDWFSRGGNLKAD
ncbi:hypothetical protein E2C01_095756 [Portunus trituberculatus]|uniref:Uncharacterized protein n=1 Tax=Portunus trituberculatus TaxID=210409 RepID=A0A5B7K6K0_PORTR|nr:hypothetical protein [Portunus trituberculatus]